MNSTILKYLPILVTVGGTLGAAILTPQFLAAHPYFAAGAMIFAQVGHAALPSVFGGKLWA